MSKNDSQALRVLVCGSREWTDCEMIRRELADLPGPVSVIHGAARGADSIAAEVANDLGHRVIACPADWKQYGKAAGLIRNKQMLTEQKPDLVLAFTIDIDRSRGTRNMIEISRKALVDVRVFQPEGAEADQVASSPAVDGRRVIAFTKVNLSYGWLGNMSPYPIRYKGDEWATAEALFQSLRFDDEAIQTEIWQQSSPMAAKMKAKKHRSRMVIDPRGDQDVENMGLVLMLKIEQHSEIRRKLLETGNAEIVEDCSSRRSSAGALFWGAAWSDGQWRGTNTLGRLWMELREEMRRGEW